MIPFSQKKRIVSNYSRAGFVTFCVLLLVGLSLRFYHYLMGRSLWEDETHLALNFMKYDFSGLMQPLDNVQAAPVFFIVIVKLFVSLFGYGELAFRALPFIVSILTLPLFYFILLDLTRSRITALIGFFIFALNLSLIYFSSELKPYALDVGVYLVLVYLTVGSNAYVKRRRMLLLTLAGSISILFSNVAFIVLFCIVCCWVLEWYKQRRVLMQHLKVMAVWLCVFSANYFLFIHHHPATEMQRLNYSFAFCPTDFLSCEFTSFLSKTLEETCFTMLLYVSNHCGFAYVLLLVFAVALRHFILKKKHTILLLVCAPVIFHLGLSMLKLYPFWYRLILYLVPCFIFLMAQGTFLIGRFVARHTRVAFGVLVTLVFCVFFVIESLRQFPFWIREIKPALDFVNTRLPRSAHVYILDPVNAYDYYYQRGYVKNKIYKRLTWYLEPAEYYELVNETSNYILVYGTLYQWGYANVLRDLRSKHLLVSNFEYKAYGVAEVKPFNPDSGVLTKTIDHTYFDPSLTFGEDQDIAIWSGNITSIPIRLQKGEYNLAIVSKGTAVAGIYPLHTLYVNAQKMDTFSNTSFYRRKSFNFSLLRDTSVALKIAMQNDLTTHEEDRNTFIHRIYITKKP